MDVKQGYKQTEVGVIPEDWEVAYASELCIKIQDGTHFSPKGIEGEFLYITSKNIRFGSLDISSASRINTEQHRAIYRRCDVKKNDILLTKDGANTGNVALNNLDEEFSLLSSVAFLRFNSRKYSPKYFLQQLLSPECQNRMQDVMAGNAITRLTLDKIRKIKFAYPPTKAEQEAIAEALSDADALVESLEQLIAKKRQIKQGAMQELLTGKKRLPGFGESWNSFRLGDHLIFLANGVNSRAELTVNDSVRYLHYGDIHGSESPRMSPSNLPTLPAEKAKSLSRLCNGDLVFADASEDVIGVGKSVEIVDADNFELVSGLHTIAVRFDKSVLADGFKAYLQFCPDFSKLLRQLAAGTKVYATSRRHVADIEMKLPSVEEQIAIASILSDMDAEIDALVLKLEKARRLKQGMMHNLLTGKIRLV
jgi:type I restriction enzyme S subunit